MRNHLMKTGKLLDSKGQLIDKGYATELVRTYNRADIKASKLRIKEWDYYYIGNNHYGIALTIADNGYMGLIGASFIDFDRIKEKTTNILTFMPCGSMKLPNTSKAGDIHFQNKRVKLKFSNDGLIRRLKFYMKNFDDNKDFIAEVSLKRLTKHDSIVVATPFEHNKKAFYYNQKIVGMTARGRIVIGEEEHIFDDSDSCGLLDWGRGVWTYNNTWYWGAAQGYINSKAFGFNIGYGFGNTSAASENMLFYEGRAHKLNDITFNIPRDSKGKEIYTDKWTFISSDGRFEMEFEPLIDRASCTNAFFILSDQHQVFGHFSGTVILDNGKKLEIKDFLGFAEKVRNKW